MNIIIFPEKYWIFTANQVDVGQLLQLKSLLLYIHIRAMKLIAVHFRFIFYRSEF